jgi:glycolate oxidase iron-sulfur subunit
MKKRFSEEQIGRMQITNSLYEADVDVVFKNPLELIAKALRE